MADNHPKRWDQVRWGRLRLAVFERDGYRCVQCGKPGLLECDHIRPVHRDGEPWDMDNLQSLCRGCHIEKTRAERGPPTPGQDEWTAYCAKLATTDRK